MSCKPDGKLKNTYFVQKETKAFNIYSRTIGGFCERVLPWICPNCQRSGYGECSSFALPGNSIPCTRTTWKGHIPTKYLIKSAFRSFWPAVIRSHWPNKMINRSFKYAGTSIHQDVAGTCNPLPTLMALQHPITSKTCKAIGRPME